jgi:hypothetical protein
MKRWVCPQCGGAQRAPERPRKDDARRYCFPCSTKTGRLVQRTCPVLDKQRYQSALRIADKAMRRVTKDKAKWMVAGLDVRRVASKCWRALKTLGYVKDHRDLPKLYVMRSNWGTRGWAHAHGTVRLYFGHGKHAGSPAPDQATVRELVLHELCHHIDRAFRDGHNHGPKFNGALCDAARHLWGFDEMSSGEGYAPSEALEKWLRKQPQEGTD